MKCSGEAWKSDSDGRKPRRRLVIGRNVRKMTQQLHTAWRGNLRKQAMQIIQGTAMSRLLGYIREVLMAAYFATSMQTDAWLMASVLPNLLFGALYGAVANLVVPLYLQAKESPSRSSADHFVQEIFTLLTAVALGLSLAAYLATPLIVRLLAPGFHGQALRLTITMTRIMLPTFVFWLWAGLFSALLQSLNRYRPPAWAPVLLNIVRITSILTLAHRMGIIGVAWGFTVGVASQLIVLTIGLHHTPIRIRFRYTLRHPLVKKFLRLATPVVITSLMGAVSMIVDRIFASELPTGYIAALNYSVLLIQLPLGLVVAPLVTPVLTTLSTHVVHRQMGAWRQMLRRSTWILVSAMGVSTLVLTVFRAGIIQVIYQHGHFDDQSTQMTAGILPYFALGLIPMALSQLYLKGLVSLQHTRSLSGWTVAAMLTNVIADVLLIHPLQGRGLALGTSLANGVYAAGMWWSLRRRMQHAGLSSAPVMRS